MKNSFSGNSCVTMRGVLAGEARKAHGFNGAVSTLDQVEVIRAPQAGTVLFHRSIGERVKAGDILATVITRPGLAEGDMHIHAPQDGLIVTRISRRYVRRNGDLMKIACAQPSARSRPPGTLED